MHKKTQKKPTPYHINTITIAGPCTASNSDTEDNSTQLKKCKSRCPTPLPAKLFSFPTYSDTEDPDNTDPEMSFTIHSQDEGSLSTDETTPETFYIPMSPPSTCQAMLPRPPYITAANDTQDQNSTADSELPVADTLTETESDADSITGPSTHNQSESNHISSLQDHIVHLPRPPCSPRPTRQHLRPCFNKNQQNKDNTTEDVITSTPPRTCPVPPPRPSKATNVKQTSANQ